jgi:galactose-1-phosphate uridylyltransferase
MGAIVFANQSGKKQKITYFDKHNRTLLQDYVQEEMKLDERIVIENEYFVAMVPFGQFGLTKL